VGQSRKRTGTDGKLRYTAYYEDVSGRRRSAGTFPNKKAADRAWQAAETRVSEGRAGDPKRGRQRFRSYVEQEWFPNHQIELTTRQAYSYQLERHILPEFGTYRMVEIMPSHVREWVQKLAADGVRAPTIRYCMTVLSAVFTTALNDQVTFLHPCMGVKTPAVAAKTLRIVTPEQFDLIHHALPTTGLRMLVETDIETGLRWGELAELRPRDMDFSTGVVTVSRVVLELVAKFHSQGQRFLVKEYPKDKEWRRLTLSAHMRDRLADYAQSLAPDDLLFTVAQPDQPRRRRPDTLPDPDTLGLTEPTAAGRRYRHGTISAYSGGNCHCQHCRDAYAKYRADRRAAGTDHPRRLRTINTDGHIPRDWFRQQIWTPALTQANLGFHVRLHDLRHAHASWLLAGGADIQVVKERLGHASITTTQRYLHTLPNADQAAVNAINTIRRPA
jgi:site-specific recombinase XerD